MATEIAHTLTEAGGYTASVECGGYTTEFGTPITVTQPQLATPTNLTTSNLTSTSADLDWNDVTNATDYTVTLDPPDAGPYNPTTSDQSITGLTASTEYTVTVVAHDSTGTYADSAEANTTFTTA